MQYSLFARSKFWPNRLQGSHCAVVITKLAIGFVRFESFRGGFVGSRFESRGLDS